MHGRNRLRAIHLAVLLSAATSALPGFALEIFPSLGTNGLFTVAFQTGADYDYVLYRGTNLNSIDSQVGAISGTSAFLQLTDTNPPTAPLMLYRLEQRPKTNSTDGLVINEIDYDQASTDVASFIELYNGSASPILLANLAVVLINGNNNGEYSRINLSGAGASELPPGGYLVIRNYGITVPVNALVMDVAGDWIQNGAPDGVALINTSNNTLIDALSYEGSITAATITGIPGTFNLVEGTAFAGIDTNDNLYSLSRLPNGQDSNNAGTDWTLTTAITPGAANQ